MRLLLTGILFTVALAPSPAAARDSDAPSALDRRGDTGGLGETDGVLGAAPSGAPAEDDLAPPSPPVDAPPVPVDGGLVLLAAAGAGYAARRLRARRR